MRFVKRATLQSESVAADSHTPLARPTSMLGWALSARTVPVESGDVPTRCRMSIPREGI